MVDPIIESVTLEPELEEALASASDAELCDIAGITHTHTHRHIHISHRHLCQFFYFFVIPVLYMQRFLLHICY